MAKKKDYTKGKVKLPTLNKDNLYIGVWDDGNYALPMIIYDKSDLVVNYMRNYVHAKLTDIRIYRTLPNENVDEIIAGFYEDLQKKCDINIFALDPWPNMHALVSMGMLISNFDVKLADIEFNNLTNEIKSGVKAICKLHFLMHESEMGVGCKKFMKESAHETLETFRYALNRKDLLYELLLRNVSPYENMKLIDLITYITDPTTLYYLDKKIHNEDYYHYEDFYESGLIY